MAVGPYVLDRRIGPVRAHRIHLQGVAAVAALSMTRPAQPGERGPGRGFEHERRLRAMSHLAGADHVGGDEAAQARTQRVAGPPPAHTPRGEVFEGGAGEVAGVRLTGVDREFAGRGSRRARQGSSDEDCGNGGQQPPAAGLLPYGPLGTSELWGAAARDRSWARAFGGRGFGSLIFGFGFDGRVVRRRGFEALFWRRW